MEIVLGGQHFESDKTNCVINGPAYAGFKCYINGS